MESPFVELPEIIPAPENLTAVLVCLGAKTSLSDREYILKRQNPYAKKRGGLSFGAYAVVNTPEGEMNFTNINVYNEQAQISPLTLQITRPERGDFLLLDGNERLFAEGNLLPVPAWGTKFLKTGKPAIAVLQQHGPINLVGVLGSPRCSLFESGNACQFCMLNGGEANKECSVEEILEAFGFAKEDKKAYNVTLTTGLQASKTDVQKIIEAVAKLKRSLGCAALALEVAPFPEQSQNILRAFKDAGLDTLMMPLDCASEIAQRRYLPGKAELLQKVYRENVKYAVELFGRGNVTSSIIVGLEPLPETLKAIERMLEVGVIPEPIPVRWDDSKISGRLLPLTNPNDLIIARQVIQRLVEQNGIREIMERTRAGCAACGGCGGIVVNNLPVKKQRTLCVLP